MPVRNESMRRRLRFPLLALGLAATLLFAGACSDDGSRDEAVASLIESGLNETEATCYADRVVDEFGSGRVVELTATDPEPTVIPEEQATLDAIRNECLNLAAYVEPSTDTTEPG